MTYVKARRWELRKASRIGTKAKHWWWNRTSINRQKKLDGLCQLAALDDALASADVLVLLVDHNEFKAIKGDAVHQQYIVDTKGVWR